MKPEPRKQVAELFANQQSPDHFVRDADGNETGGLLGTQVFMRDNLVVRVIGERSCAQVRVRTTVGALPAFAVALISALLVALASSTGAIASTGAKLGRTIVVVPVKGKGRVLVRLPRMTRYVVLRSRRVIPVGSAIDTTHGAVDLSSAGGPGVGLQKGVFNGGAFVVAQPRTGQTNLDLIGGLRPTACLRPAAGTDGSAAAAPSQVLRTLHGHAHGKFRTRGRFAAATIRGTEWTTTDTCAGTMISDQKSTVVTSATQAHLTLPPLSPGESVQYRCAPNGQPPVSERYCVAVLSAFSSVTSNGVTTRFANYATGLSTRGPDETNQLCVTPPTGVQTCTPYQLTPPDSLGNRFSIVTCAPSQGPGKYSISWRLGGVQLGAPMIYTAPRLPTSASQCAAWLGQPLIGPRVVGLDANVKRVNEYTLPAAGTVVWMYSYLGPTGTPGAEQVQGVVYDDAGGTPGALVGTTVAVTITPKSAQTWYQLPFPQQLHLQPGNYWIGLLTGGTSAVAGSTFSTVPQSAPANDNVFSAGPSNPFGPITRVGDTLLSQYLFYVNGG
ncbi:MAG: SchA/CurD-like domain-containing protein [Solirubrobacteraceae bacterium]